MRRLPERTQGFAARGRLPAAMEAAATIGAPADVPATCSKCGKSTEVPFRPTNGKPVYCSDCFRTVRGN